MPRERIGAMRALLGDFHPNQILIFDPGCASLNIGDEIISDSARRQLNRYFPDYFFARVSTHQHSSFRYRRLLRGSRCSFALGSNLLKGHMLFGFRQWDISILDTLQVNNIVLVGCGWQTYIKNDVDIYSKLLYRHLLSNTYSHSVRDRYTKRILEDLGFSNVINTGCPTIWGFTPEFCASIPTSRSNKVVTTVTDYSRDHARDSAMLDQLLDCYRAVYVWPQGSGDYSYLQELGYLDKLSVIPSTLKSYDDFLDENAVDYVGTRLHGGIRALQHGRRSIIVSIDNRAREMGTDVNLPVLDGAEIDQLENIISHSFDTSIQIDQSGIREFLGQFERHQLCR